MRKILLSVGMLTLFLTSNLYAVDELVICGRVTKVRGTLITLKVRQETCRGERDFRISPELQGKIRKGIFICFETSALPNCNGSPGTIREILTPRRPKP